MTFAEYVAFYGLTRSEGLVLRYLGDAYRALRQTVPESVRTDELEDIIEWLGAVVRQTDSSLLDEWEQLSDPDRSPRSPPDVLATGAGADHRQRARVHGAGAQRAVPPGRAGRAATGGEQLGELEAEAGSTMTAEDWREALGDVLRRARRDRHRSGRARPADAARREAATQPGRSSRSSATPRATTTGGSPRRSTSTASDDEGELVLDVTGLIQL